jgi:UDP-N-acetylglucosamine acyltransferase
MTAPAVDPTAQVAPGAELGEGAAVGPYCVIGPQVTLGPGCRLDAHVVIGGRTRIGAGCRFFPFSSIGSIPQDLKFGGEDTRLEIGPDNTFREYVTVNVGTAGGGGVTRIGRGGFFMACAHVAHDCIVGDGVILANGATLAGHVAVEDGATIGAFSGVHQFCRIGREAFLGGYSVVTQDAVPYVKIVGNRARAFGINVIGLQRRGYPAGTIESLKRAYRLLFRSKIPLARALETVEAEIRGVPEVDRVVAFIRASERGVVR